MKRILLFSAVLCFGAAAWANGDLVPKLGSGEAFSPDQELVEGFVNSRYQIGDEWGKKPVTQEMINRSPAFRRAIKATARVGGATGFYLGKFNGTHVVATNKHVCPSTWSCRGRIRFPHLNNSSFSANGVIGRWPNVDLALVEISVPSSQESELMAVAGNFAFAKPLVPGQKLITVGFGTANNRRRQMVANFDSDCLVFSGTGEYRHMRDPDQINTGRDLVWSFSNGCDVSHGDSGSAMVDRESGEVVGIIWTGRIPKNARIQNSRYLEEVMQNRHEDIWQELSYAAPAAKIKEELSRAASSSRTSDRTKQILRAIIAE